MVAAAVPADTAPVAARSRPEPLERWRRGRARRAAYGFPPVWVAAVKVAGMVTALIAAFGVLPALVLRLVLDT